MPKRYAIVGLGAAGLMSFHELVIRHLSESDLDVEIMLFDKGPRKKFGCGLAYGTDIKSHILNLPAGFMNVSRELPENAKAAPLDSNIVGESNMSFVDWAEKHKDAIKEKYGEIEITKASFPPRAIFGEYLNFVFEAVLSLAESNGIRVIVSENTEIKTILPGKGKAPQSCTVITGTGKSIEADIAILCIGHLPADTYTDLKNRKGYYHSPWLSKKELDKLSKKKQVVLLGTRLTAFDTAFALLENEEFRGKITLVSRSGFVPTVLGPTSEYRRTKLTLEEINIQTLNGTKPLSLSVLMRLFWKELANALGKEQLKEDEIHSILNPTESPQAWLEREIAEAQQERRWQSFLFSLYRFVPQMWHALDNPGKKEFLENYYSIWMTYLAAFPRENAEKLLGYLKAGKIEIRGGLSEVKYSEEERSFKISFKDNTPPINAKTVINATGAGHNIKDSGMDLLDNLSEQGVITPNELGGVTVKFKSLEPKDSNGNTVDFLRVIGDATFGSCMATADLTQVWLEVIRMVADIRKPVNNSVNKREIGTPESNIVELLTKFSMNTNVSKQFSAAPRDVARQFNKHQI